MRLTACDGPDCEQVMADPLPDDDGEPDGWLHVEARADEDCGDYCSWECLAARAMALALDDTRR